MTSLLLRGLSIAAALVMMCGTAGAAGSGVHESVSADEARPRIALVLGGGGALGGAHIGVLKELDRRGIRPDIVVGTSMGAVVGGLYAAGYSGAELETILGEIVWASLFDDAPPRADRDYRQKEDDAAFLIDTQLGIGPDGVRGPLGLVRGQALTLKLRELVARRHPTGQVDGLAVPFRAVATDLESGAAVVLGAGDLASAMRASMSVPGVFPPVEREVDGRERLLVDGGLANNVPADVARAMGADILIVVQLKTALLKRGEFASALDVVNQTITLLILKNEREQVAKLGAADILIEPDLTGYGAADFDRIAAMVPAGVVAARARAAALDAIAPAADGPRPEHADPVAAAPVIDRITIANETPLGDDVIRARIRQQEGEGLDLDGLTRDLNAIAGLGIFETVDFRIRREGGETVLVVNATERRQGLWFLRGGITLDSNFRGDATWELSGDVLRAGIGSLGAEWRTELVLGSRQRLLTEFWQPIDENRLLFVNPRLEVNGRDVPVFDGEGRRRATYRAASIRAALEAGRAFGGDAEIRAGIALGGGRIELREGVGVLPQGATIDIGEIYLQAGLDTVDNVAFPTSGARNTLRIAHGTEWLGGESYTAAFLEARRAFAIAPRDTVIIGAQAGLTFDGRLPFDQRYRLGGFLSLSGLARDELQGSNVLVGRIAYLRKLTSAEPLLFGLPVWAGASLEAGNVYERREDITAGDVIVGGSVFAGADTGLGPVYLGYGHASGGRDALYLAIGRRF